MKLATLINPWGRAAQLEGVLAGYQMKLAEERMTSSRLQQELLKTARQLELARHELATEQRRVISAVERARQDAAAEVVKLRERLEVLEAVVKAPVAVEFADAEPAWLPDYEDGWRHFLTSTEAGAALMRQANWAEQGCNRRAIGASGAAEGAIGEARGWHRATQYFFHTLSAKLRPQQQQDTQAPEADALRERLAS